ncbi:transglycosylase domain-containing protein [Candidatus Dependentiae bacterium]
MLHNKVVDFSALEQYDPRKPTILLDDEGNEWARFQLDRREPVSLDRMPKHLINALVAIEDWKFFSHCGLSFKGIARAMWKNIRSGRMGQGASTITQQLVRLLFFDAKKTFKRKIKEQLYTLLVERQFSKEQIIETYLNHVCFGRGVYGVQAASKRFWQKDVSEISLEQAALLAGNIQRPEGFWPFAYPLSAQKRRNSVLFKMKKLGFITEGQYKQAKAIPVTLQAYGHNTIAPYLKEHIRMFLQNLVGKERLYAEGLFVQTTLHRSTQELAGKSFYENIQKLKKKISDRVNGALISLDVQTGEIKALIGGADFKKSQYNRVFQAKRQMGSVFKPILYSRALMSGLSFCDVEIDEPLEIECHDGSFWRPKNAYGDFDGRMTLAWGLSISNNILAIKTLLKVGITNVIDLAKKFNFSSELKPYPSIALGCIDVTLKESTAMFNAFANNGTYVEPHCIKWVKNNLGEKIFKYTRHAQRVINARVSGQVSKVLQLGLKRIKKYFPQKWVTCEAISKTGTTNDSRVCWFIGSTPTLTTGVYIGRDDNQPMGKNIYPLRTAFPIWIGLNRELNFNIKNFSYDPSLQEICINKKTGQPTSATDPHAINIFV